MFAFQGEKSESESDDEFPVVDVKSRKTVVPKPSTSHYR